MYTIKWLIFWIHIFTRNVFKDSCTIMITLKLFILTKKDNLQVQPKVWVLVKTGISGSHKTLLCQQENYFTNLGLITSCVMLISHSIRVLYS